MSPPLLEAERFGVDAAIGGARIAALRDVSFRLEPGRVLALVGESGAGKSMIGRAIAGDLPQGFRAGAGRLAFDGLDLAAAPRERVRALLGRDIAFIPQEPLSALNPVRTVGGQFDEHLSRIRPESPPAERRARALAALESVRLPRPAELLRAYPHQLSGGMSQRVLIAMAFASEPRLVVADEPTTALDVTVQAGVVKLLRDLQERSRTAVLFITHDLRLAAHVADEVLVLYAGRPVERGPPALLARPAHPYTRCLELAAPVLTGPRRALYALPDVMPGLVAAARLPGCRFAPRCLLALPACSDGEPAFAAVGPDHVSACIRPRDVGAIRTPPAEPPHAVGEGETLLETRDLTRRFVLGSGVFASKRTLTAVKDARFALRRGEFVGVIGESGSGKSTLARLIVGLERPSSGSITLAGQDVTANDGAARALRRRLVQMVFQDPQSALNPRRRVGSIVTQALEAASPRPAPAERSTRSQAALAAVGLPPEMAARFPAQLSGGQKQRVNIARALVAEPIILVADEIVSGLDVSVQAQLLDLLARLRRSRDFSLLFISHDLSVVRHLCDRALVMRAGEIVEDGPVEALFAAPKHPYTRDLIASIPPDVRPADATEPAGETTF